MTVKGVSLRHAPLLARMLFWRATLPVAKRFIAIERLVHLLAFGPRREGRPEDLKTVVRIGSRLWRSADGPCLERSLALYHELGRLGAQPELVLGIAKAEEGLAGHAWIEVARHPLLEATNPKARFPVVVRFRADGHRTGQATPTA